MRVLITWGSKRGGTEGLATAIAGAMRARGIEVVLAPADEALQLRDFDAAIIGGALYSGRWHPAARRFVRRRAAELRRVPTWFFSSGPLDASAGDHPIAPVRQVEALMALVGAQGHATFGGRLLPDADTLLAKKHAGDWRDFSTVSAWARGIVAALPAARPRPVVAAGHSLARLVAYAVAAWGACAALFLALLWVSSLRVAVDTAMAVAPVVYIAAAWRYFGARAPRDPLPAAFAFAAVAAVLAVAAFSGAATATWLLVGLVFVVTLATGAVRAMTPSQPRRSPPAAHALGRQQPA